MEQLGRIGADRTPAQVFIAYFDAGHLGDYFRIAAAIRAAGLAVEVYPEPAKLGKKLQYADRKGFRAAIIAGEREFAAGECQVKNLASGQSISVPLAEGAGEVLAEVRRILAN
jgi:histidyl-tRNA synthetase